MAASNLELELSAESAVEAMLVDNGVAAGGTGGYTYTIDQEKSTWPSPLFTYSVDAYQGSINFCPVSAFLV